MSDGGALSGTSQVCILGPVGLRTGPNVASLSSDRQRCILAALAVRANETVAIDALIDSIWGDRPPATAQHALQVHVSALRQLLASTGIEVVTRSPGYALSLSRDQLDADVFERHSAVGRAALASGDLETALDWFDRALALWRGAVLADVGWDRFAEAEVYRLDELRRSTTEDRQDALLGLGRDVVAEAEALVADEPLRERRWCQLMLALHRAGRQTAALRRADDLRRKLRDEMGVEPGAAVRSLTHRILSQDPSLLGPTLTGGPGRSGAIGPVTRFVEAAGLHIAYQVLGKGPPDLLFIPGFAGHLELRWEDPTLSGFYQRLARSSRLLLIDKPGTGLSDRGAGILGVEQQVAHIRAFLDKLEVDRAVLFGIYDGAAVGLLTAAAHPDRVEAVVTYSASVAPGGTDTRLATPPELVTATRAALARGWGSALHDVIELWAPSRVGDDAFARWSSRYLRMGVSVGDAVRLYDEMLRVDIRGAVADVECPVLALHRAGDRMAPMANARWLEAHLPRGRAVVVPGKDSILWAGDVNPLAAEIERFLESLSEP